MPGKGNPFKPGKSGNPNGAPKKKYSFTNTIMEVLQKRRKVFDKKTKKYHFIYPIELLHEKIVQLLLIGDSHIIKMLWEQLDGRAAQKIDLKASLSDVSDIEKEDIIDLYNKMKGDK